MNLVIEKPDPGGTITVIGKGRKSPLQSLRGASSWDRRIGGTCETA